MKIRPRLARLVGAVVVLLGSQSAVAQVITSTPLRNDRSTVEWLYETISVLPTEERSGRVLTLPLTMQEDLWTVHLERYLAANPDLGAAQRGVVFSALGLLGGGVIERRQAGAVEAASAEASLRNLEAQAKACFNAGNARALFQRMGGPERGGTGASARRLLLRSCNCSTQSDWCDTLTNPFPKCSSQSRCSDSLGCGTLFLYACDGLCE